MFESAELGHSIDKRTYARAVPKLRAALLDAQYDLSQAARFPVLILVSGVDGAGKGETVNLLNEWMDPRHIRVHGFGDPSDEERERPAMFRFWRCLPPRGKTGIFFGSWYTQPIVDRVTRSASRAELGRALDEIVRFERMLTDEGVLLFKLWFHLSKERQRKRLRELEKDPATRWRVTPLDWRRFELYDRFREVSDHALRQTSTAEAPWLVVEGGEARYRSLTVGKLLLEAMRRRLGRKAPAASTRAAPSPSRPLDDKDVLRALDLSQRVPRDKYAARLEKAQGELNLLSRDRRFGKLSVVAVFEGNDAAGKGGAIRRITSALDARSYSIVPIAAPTEEERAQPYLWRFWRQLPRRGHLTIFDRSWYGRVLVERVEGFCSEVDWARAYEEINDFEEQLARGGIVVVKFWLAISKDEQLRRFKEREKVQFKRFKITAEDWRNRKKWDSTARAVCDLVDRTSTEIAPWTLVEANDKYFARLKVLRTLADRIQAALA
jgi:polyphosphate:AMP phosphotransferase